MRIAIEIWSDVVCPFCYIGKKHLEAAIDKLGANHLDIVWRSFELNPYAPIDEEDDYFTMLANKYRQSVEWARNTTRYMTERGKEVGIQFDFERCIATNTHDAHRLLHLAKKYDLQSQMKETLLRAHFSERRHIGREKVLRYLAAQVGLDEEEVVDVLRSGTYSNEVREDEKRAAEIGIQGVPFFIVANDYAISGAQPVERFVEVLEKAHAGLV